MQSEQEAGGDVSSSQRKISSADAGIEIVWDEIGVAHVYASTIADAYRGMGYAAASERLWQIHMSTAYANGEAAKLLGGRFVGQDAIQRACNVHGAETGLPSSEGDWIANAYLDGMNAFIDELDELPPEFASAGAEPRRFSRADIAARYRFTSWFQHKSWTEKMLIGRLMATHGVDYFRDHLLHFSAADEALIEELREPLSRLSVAAFPLAYPDFSPASLSGSNNWAVTGALSASGKPILATDPHQPHTIPNTFFYVHLHAGDWDAFGAAFPGVPYFMMGYTRDIAWGLTTGFVDCYDVYLERIQGGQYLRGDEWRPLASRTERIEIKGGSHRNIEVLSTPHGPLLEHLTDQLGLSEAGTEGYASALRWTLADLPSSAGALAQLPLATSAEAFGDALFEDDVCPLVNNIICVDRNDHLRRFIATTLPARQGVTGSVPLKGWDASFDFPISSQEALTVEIDPASGYSLTANNDTMEDRGPYPVHNFPTHSARAERIREILEARRSFTVADFQQAQLDLTDLRARALVPDLIAVLQESGDPELRLAAELLGDWDCRADLDSAAACVFYPFLDRNWHRQFMREVLREELINVLPVGAPGLNRFEIGRFLSSASPWAEHREDLVRVVQTTMKSVLEDVRTSLGDDSDRWRWGDLHQIRFAHRLAGKPTWEHMQVGPDPIGGSATTLGMAMHIGPGPGSEQAETDTIACRVYHGPAFRLVVDLADPDHAQFVIAGGNGGRPESPHGVNHYEAWLRGEYFRLSLIRKELEPTAVWRIGS
jgi:penicillin amidase